MESQLQNPEFRNNPENFYPCFLAQMQKKNMCGNCQKLGLVISLL